MQLVQMMIITSTVAAGTMTQKEASLWPLFWSTSSEKQSEIKYAILRAYQQFTRDSIGSSFHCSNYFC